MPYQLPVWVWPVALIIVCIIAVRRGRDEERLLAAAVLLCWALSMVVYRARSQDTQWAVTGIDTVLLLLYLWIVLRTRRYWPLFGAAFQLLVVVTHLAHAVDPTIGGWAYWTAARLWTYLALFTIGYGAWTAPRYADSMDEPIVAAGATRR